MSESGNRQAVHPLAQRLEAYPAVAAELDDRGVIVFANARLRELSGGAAAPGTAFESLLDENSVAKWRRALLDGGPAVSVELHMHTRDGIAPHTFFVSAADAGARTLIELPRDPDVERLHEAANALNSELVNAQREISRQKGELERVINSRERFYSAMSHELRTPLTAVLGYTHLLLDGIAGALTEQQRGFIERSHTAALHLKSLIDDVLDLAKLGSGTLELDLAQTNIRPLANELADTVQPLAREHGSTLILELDEAPEFLTTDTRALRQILLNLLSNAIKFGESRPVRLRCRRAGDSVVFEVIDRGQGIPQDQIDRVFDEFVQLHPSAHAGTGLGLSISRQLTQRLGGRLEAESAPGAGSTFRLTLPMTGPAPT